MSAFTRVHSPYLKGVYARLRGLWMGVNALEATSGRRWLRCARLQISRLSAVEPPGLNEGEPGWLASTEDTDEVDAHHACGRRLRRRVHRPGGAGASGRHVAHAARLRDAAGAHRREPALLRHLRVWTSQAAVRLHRIADQARCR